MRHVLLLLGAILLLAGCGNESRRPDQGISEQEAIASALEIASTSRPELSGAQVPPTDIHAEQMSLGEAIKRIDNSASVPAGYDPEMPVWLVTMDGIWFDEFPRPTDLPTPEPYRHYLVIVDGKSGMGIQVTARP